ncbi:MAG: hypothetical protein M3N43_13670 [Actinomycetota bacterium]|nr:hypothetical protein [Actinomycetota bacterium]
MTRSRILHTAVVGMILMTACGGPTGGDTTTTTGLEPTTTATSAASTTTAASGTTTVTSGTTTATSGETTTTSSANVDGSEGSGCTPGTDGTLPEGHWFGFVVSTAADSIEFDLACWFSGQAAIDAAAEDGEESPPPNDYYIRNQNELTRTVVVWSDVTVLFYPTGDPTSETEGTFEEWTDAASVRGYFFGVWLDVIDGEARMITEQWVP